MADVSRQALTRARYSLFTIRVACSYGLLGTAPCIGAVEFASVRSMRLGPRQRSNHSIEFSACLKDITSAEQFAGTDPEKLPGVAFLRGAAHLQMKDFSGPSTHLEEAIRRGPKGAVSALARRRLEQLRSGVRVTQ